MKTFLKIAGGFVVLFVLVRLCSGTPPTETANTEEKKQQPKNATIPAYTIIQETPIPASGRTTVDIEIQVPLTKEQLTAIALQLRETRQKYDRVWISYYLSFQKRGSSAWATAQFTPELSVEILGATDLALAELEAYTPEGTVLASWREYDRETPKRIFWARRGKKELLVFVYARGTAIAPIEKAIIPKPVRSKSMENGTIVLDDTESGETYFISSSDNSLSMYSGIDQRKFGQAISEQVYQQKR
jgi:hypothetical protein